MSSGFIRLILPIGAIVVISTSAMMAKTSEPAPASELIFTHALHVIDQELDCTVCHNDIKSSTSVEDRNLPSMDICADCHDVEDDENCGQCHRNPDEPMPAPDIVLTALFSHKRHLDNDILCRECHGKPVAANTAFTPEIPGKPKCMNCHDGLRVARDCNLCHGDSKTLADIHPVGWRHQHAETALQQPQWCQTCHQQETYCVNCHRGDNTTGTIHDLNYRFTHGLDARGKIADCERCHDRQEFCNECHLSQNRMPLNHSTLAWRSDHGTAARIDVEDCASCHEADDPTCARSGCHRDEDGIRGTDARIHASSISGQGEWHEDAGYFCFACHTRTGRSGVGFCGYCHGNID